MVEVLNYEDDYVFTTSVVLPRVPSLLVSSRPRKEFRKDLSTLMNSLVPLSRPYRKDTDVVDDINTADTTVD